jgi:hypothetical protein
MVIVIGGVMMAVISLVIVCFVLVVSVMVSMGMRCDGAGDEQANGNSHC